MSEDDLIEGLINPDSYSEITKFDMREETQRLVLGMMLTDQLFLIHCAALIKPKYFQNEAHEDIAKIVIEYWDKYKSTPNIGIIKEEIFRKYPDDNRRLRDMAELDSTIHYFVPGLDTREYLINIIVTFAKVQATRLAIAEVIDVIRKNPYGNATWEQVDKILDGRKNIDQHFDLGMQYKADFRERYKRAREKQELQDFFPTAIKPVDDVLRGGADRGEIVVAMGSPGSGKSLWLVKAAVANLLRGRKVLYVTVEMNTDKTAFRFDAQLANNNINTLLENEQIVKQTIDDALVEFSDERLILKHFPSRSLTMTQLRAYYQQVKLHGFKPDLFILDYVGEMKEVPGVPTHEGREKIVAELRGFAIEENHCCMTVLQPNRDGEKVVAEGGVMDQTNIGDAYGQFRVCDVFWTINQTAAQKEAGVAKGFIAKARDGDSKILFYLGYDYGKGRCFENGRGTLGMSEITREMYQLRMSDREEKDVVATAQDVSFDDSKATAKNANSKPRKQTPNPLGDEDPTIQKSGFNKSESEKNAVNASDAMKDFGKGTTEG